ncbi:endonuclease/exonuclease/phosphatase family protein [Romboutsia sp. 1001216sp1]|uniref:endonuclease/exonuclease/phosphatase family protein n=1 Tax=Romboutsia TaxID=1501226 RepID=UPI000B0B5A4C|nr:MULTISPECIES: endonuclease/exonuclease/phosphatase family protein [Romboutsia]MDB8793471.1 endonuclease/exonuclease/phosphatase family protein [Romboutsia sp. 1001216sp1]MDB8797013.1 endonuclease/exonuclease/phosphatase family protein [Romboutsia sp. 1001216sp1]MDB8799759.1 endonuclease/exonuclease/phosphatase family protein [Romboutsia sp. 1001216sp1]
MKMVTYNIHKASDLNNKNTLNKITKYLKSKEFDVICLQEVLYPQFAKLKQNLNMDGVFCANIINQNMMYGICTFSKYEIDVHEHVLLTSKKEQRGFLYTNVFSKNGKFNIINTHLGLDKNERYIQINEILNYSNKLPNKIIICGDLNEKNLSINKYNDVAIYTGNFQKGTFIKNDARIDYIFSDKLITIDDYYIDKIDYSDHYPIICKFR